MRRVQSNTLDVGIDVHLKNCRQQSYKASVLWKIPAS